jgi:hypothetical protein
MMGCVVALRSRRLEAMFGVPLDALTADAISGLVETRAQEDFDLDFKVQTYGRGESDKISLGTDVAAMANTAGGVIVIGVDEDDQARAQAAPGVDITDSETGRIRQIVASRVAPLPVFDVLTVFDTDARDGDGDEAASPTDAPVHGFIVLAVPRSQNAPHAVVINDAMRFPRRHGRTTYYLSESDVAAAYRDRTLRAAQQNDRIASVESDALARLDDENSWVVVTLVPDLPGEVQITTATFEDFRRAIINTDPGVVPSGSVYMHASVGRRRFLADGSLNDARKARYNSLDLHGDGAGAFGFELHDMRQQFGGFDSEGHAEHLVSDEMIVVGVLSGLVRLAAHARDRAAAGGNAVVRATIVHSVLATSVRVGHSRQFGQPSNRSATNMPLDGAVAEAVAPLEDLASPGPILISTAASLVDELGQAFGIAEMGQVSRAGEIRRRYWGTGWAKLVEDWASKHGIAVTDETLR